jgi:predicted RNA-binding Zn-ribbon protein involved in translation (DUF1610 family)
MISTDVKPEEARARRAFLENGVGAAFFFSHCGETWGVCKEFSVIVTEKSGNLSTTFLCPDCGEPMKVAKGPVHGNA